MKTPPIVSPEEWNAAQAELLVKEKADEAPATRWPPSGGGCPGWRWRRIMSSMVPRAR